MNTTGAFKRMGGAGFIALVALTGCGSDDTTSSGDVDLATVEAANSDSTPVVAGNSFEAAVQGTWTCQKARPEINGARMYLFEDTDYEVPLIPDGTRLDVGDGTWTVMTEDFKGSGTYTVDGDTWTLTPDFGGGALSQTIGGVPTTTEEAASQAVLDVHGGRDGTMTRMAMSSPTTIDFFDDDDRGTNCYKH